MEDKEQTKRQKYIIELRQLYDKAREEGNYQAAAMLLDKIYE